MDIHRTSKEKVNDVLFRVPFIRYFSTWYIEILITPAYSPRYVWLKSLRFQQKTLDYMRRFWWWRYCWKYWLLRPSLRTVPPGVSVWYLRLTADDCLCNSGNAGYRPLLHADTQRRDCISVSRLPPFAVWAASGGWFSTLGAGRKQFLSISVSGKLNSLEP